MRVLRASQRKLPIENSSGVAYPAMVFREIRNHRDGEEKAMVSLLFFQIEGLDGATRKQLHQLRDVSRSEYLLLQRKLFSGVDRGIREN